MSDNKIIFLQSEQLILYYIINEQNSITKLSNFNIFDIKQLKENGINIDFFIEFPDENKYNIFFNSFEMVKLISQQINSSKVVRSAETGQKIKTYKLNIDKISDLNSFIRENKGRLQYQQIIKLLGNLSEQCFYLENNDKALSHINPDFIFIINDDSFYYLGIENCFNGERKKMFIKNDEQIDSDKYNISKEFSMKLNAIQIDKIMDIHFAMEPNLIQLIERNKIPYKINSNIWTYSLALICIYCLSGRNDFIGKNKDYLFELLEPIINTKLWYCLNRCLNEKIFIFL